MTTDTVPQAVLFPDLFDKPLFAKFNQEQASSDGGAVLLKAAERVYGLVKAFARCLSDKRAPEKIRHTLADLIGQRIFGIACGHPDCNDAEHLADDPIHKLLLGRDPVAGESLASQPTLSRFENAAGRGALSLRIRRGRWRARALAASPTAAERTARCSTGMRRAPKNSSAMARSSLFALASSADLGACTLPQTFPVRRAGGQCLVAGMLRRSGSRLGVSMALLSGFQRTIAGQFPSRNVQYDPPRLSGRGSTSPSLTVHLCLTLFREIGECTRSLPP